jgi:hypothetical protein
MHKQGKTRDQKLSCEWENSGKNGSNFYEQEKKDGSFKYIFHFLCRFPW